MFSIIHLIHFDPVLRESQTKNALSKNRSDDSNRPNAGKESMRHGKQVGEKRIFPVIREHPFPSGLC